MRVLTYNHLDVSGVKAQYERVVEQLAAGNFRGADVRKMRNTGLYRAKLNEADRLLFKIGSYRGETVLLILEVVLNHHYEGSRFLRGAQVAESQFTPLEGPSTDAGADAPEKMVFLNPNLGRFHLLDRIISFDDEQFKTFRHRLPLILIGAAGSGKTVLLMERIKEMAGDVLYVTRSPHLADHARRLYYALNYTREDQQIEFMSFDEFLSTVRIPEGRPVDYRAFAGWYARHSRQYPFKNPHMLFEEFSGVLTGTSLDTPCLSREDYLQLGIRRSIFEPNERALVYDVFEKYVAWMRDSNLHDHNMLASEYRAHVKPSHDFVAVDEIQDLTNAQVALILMALKKENNFILCGDSNQIVHPNFFSWSALKTMFYLAKTEHPTEIVRVLHQNYRNAARVVEVANNLLRIKVARFGSIDRESNYLVRCVTDREGDVELLRDQAAANKKLDDNTRRSARYAVLVMRDEDKAAARKYFQTPLLFSIQEAKGLEYENIILYNFVSGHRKEFEEITNGLRPEDLQGELDYARAKDKTDKSLEIFKFYTNALYVGMTRAVERVFWIEQDVGHRLLQLLQLTERLQSTQTQAETSTDDEWRAEAQRLEKKGNYEQAEQIRKQVLKQQDVPWTIWTPENLPELRKQALDPASFNKKAKQQLFEYAIVYGDTGTLNELAELKFNRAKKEQDSKQVDLHYGQDYLPRDFKSLRADVRRYGVDFRNALNQTPLMVAARLGKRDILEWLIQEGASLDATDNAGHTVFWQVILQHARGTGYPLSANDLAFVYDSLAPPFLDVAYQNRLLRLDKHLFDYWMLVVFIRAHANYMARSERLGRSKFVEPMLGADALVALVADMPESVMPAFRKKRAYLSSALARNECNSKSPYSRRIVQRLRRGEYVVNTDLQIKVADTWLPVQDMYGGDLLQKRTALWRFWQDETRRRMEGWQAHRAARNSPLPRGW